MPDTPVAIVTGAGSGIGRATSLRLAAAGYRVALAGRTESSLRQTSALMSRRTSDAPPSLVVPADVGVESESMAVIDRVLAQWSRIDALVNNAGRAIPRLLKDSDAASITKTFAVNVLGPMHMVIHAWQSFETQRQGCVVNVSSAASHDPFPTLGVYGAAKSALEGLTRAIAVEGHEIGLRAYSVAPGAVETPMLRSIVSTDQLSPDNTLDPDEVARVIVDCIEAKYPAGSGATIRLSKL